MNFEIGDIVKLKKPHPCGSQEWEISHKGSQIAHSCVCPAQTPAKNPYLSFLSGCYL